mmetsp:Transcript_48191/g.122326  ORF Transcript_48191/g.122326 Transcript_48191/m.122326 type:complete len:441 (-) Transcript_48191:129-1451(-)
MPQSLRRWRFAASRLLIFGLFLVGFDSVYRCWWAAGNLNSSGSGAEVRGDPSSFVPSTLRSSGQKSLVPCRSTVGQLASGIPRNGGALHNEPTGGTDLDVNTVDLHRMYHDATVEYVAQNFDWVNEEGYALDVLLSDAERDQVWRASRARLFQWPSIEPQHMHDVRFGAQRPQRFVSRSADAAALGDPGDNVFVINLPRRPSKLRHVLHELHEAGISATVVDAIDGDVFTSQEDMTRLEVSTLPGYCGHQNTLPYLTSGQLGCFMSHFAIWHHMVENNIESALILEDDFDLQENFAQRFGQYLEEASAEDWNLLYLGRSPTEGDWRTVSEHIVEPGYTLWTVAYVIKLDVARTFVERHVEKELAPLDHYFSVAMGKGLDLHWNEQALEWAKYIPGILRGLAVTPPLVMPYAGSMVLSDTAMLRSGTKYMKDLPATDPEEG